jgi:ribonuclease HI
VALDSPRTITFSWVKGHSGDVMNDFVDSLATAAADAQRGAHS